MEYGGNREADGIMRKTARLPVGIWHASTVSDFPLCYTWLLEVSKQNNHMIRLMV